MHNFLDFIHKITELTSHKVLLTKLYCKISKKTFILITNYRSTLEKYTIWRVFFLLSAQKQKWMSRKAASHSMYDVVFVRACGGGRSVSAWNCTRTSNKSRHSDWEQNVLQHGYETSVVHVPSMRVYFGRTNGVYSKTKHTQFSKWILWNCDGKLNFPTLDFGVHF